MSKFEVTRQRAGIKTAPGPRARFACAGGVRPVRRTQGAADSFRHRPRAHGPHGWRHQPRRRGRCVPSRATKRWAMAIAASTSRMPLGRRNKIEPSKLDPWGLEHVRQFLVGPVVIPALISRGREAPRAVYWSNITVARARAIFSDRQSLSGPGAEARSAIDDPWPGPSVIFPESVATVTVPSMTMTPYWPSMAPPQTVVPQIPRVETSVSILTSASLKSSTNPQGEQKRARQ